MDSKNNNSDEHYRRLYESLFNDYEKFIYTVSHDLRAPTQYLLGFSQLLKDALSQPDNDAVVNDYLSKIINTSQQLTDMIEAMLQLSRLNTREMVMEKTNLRLMLDEIAAGVTKSHPEVDIVIESLPDIYCDKSLMHEVFDELINNAIKFSDCQERPIQIVISEVKTSDQRPTIMVQDNGVGFNPEYQDKLFELFQKLHSKKQFSGLGTGLPKVKKMIALHGGEIWANSEAEYGAKFYMAFPHEHNQSEAA